MSLRLAFPFNLQMTLCCGQVFLWEHRRDWWFGVVGGKVLRIRQCEGLLEYAGADEGFVKHYFRLDDDLDTIAHEISKDEHIKTALDKFWGLRLVRQEPWECLISFICATYKSVAAIRLMLQKLSERFGERLRFDDGDFYGFPTATRLASAKLAELEACGLGYRAKYVSDTSRMVVDGAFDVAALKKMPYADAKHVLMGFPGVGAKVADCVLLFSLEKLEAFPLDVWMKRVLLRHYAPCLDAYFVRKLAAQNGLSDTAYERLTAFARAYFGKFAGYAQEYLYHYERCLGNRKLEKESNPKAKPTCS
jgi:N-glycosylase/DNA lyase